MVQLVPFTIYRWKLSCTVFFFAFFFACNFSLSSAFHSLSLLLFWFLKIIEEKLFPVLICHPQKILRNVPNKCCPVWQDTCSTEYTDKHWVHHIRLNTLFFYIFFISQASCRQQNNRLPNDTEEKKIMIEKKHILWRKLGNKLQLLFSIERFTMLSQWKMSSHWCMTKAAFDNRENELQTGTRREKKHNNSKWRMK